MNEQLYTPKQLSELLGVTQQTLLQWENSGKLKATKTSGGHRRYVYHSFPTSNTIPSNEKRTVIYARVSSSKQKADLQRQVAMLQTEYPEHEIIQEVGSGINFKRRGLLSLLDDVLAGRVSEVVVAHRDRLSRFGFELFQHVFKRCGTVITVHGDSDVEEPFQQLAKDLFSIVTVFSARYYGSRSYGSNDVQEAKVLPKPRTNHLAKQMPRRIKVFLQPRGSGTARKRGEERNAETSKPQTIGNGK